MRIGSRGESYIGSLKNILEKFYEEPLVGFFILCRERGGMWLCAHSVGAFQEELRVMDNSGIP